MRKAVIVGMMALAGCGGMQCAETAGYRVTVYLQGQQVANPGMLFRAEAVVTSMFAGVGVRVRWELGSLRARAWRQEGRRPAGSWLRHRASPGLSQR